MEMSRRLFLGGLVTIAAATQVRAVDRRPILWGDGIHDDAPALNAWLRGEPVRIMDDAFALQGDDCTIDHARLLISETIDLRKGGRPLVMTNCLIKTLPNFRGDAMMRFGRGATGSLVQGNMFMGMGAG